MPPSIPRPSAAQPLTIRLLIELFEAGELPNVAEIDVEPRYGYVARLVYRDGSARLMRGANLDVNPLGATEIARDKSYTKYFLDRLGYRTPRGEAFLFPHFEEVVHRNLGRHSQPEHRRAEDAPAYVRAHLGYPCYVKPNNGSQGRGVSRCVDEAELRAALARLEDVRTDVALIEEEIPLPDYRVVVLRNEVIAAYLRAPLRVIGDGQATIRDLLLRKQEAQTAGGGAVIHIDDPRIAQRLGSCGLTLDSVLPRGVGHQVYDIANLSAGGEARDCADALHPHWRELCVRLTGEMGLRLCGVDLACADVRDPEAMYSVIELNAAPGLDHYAALGARQAAVVRDLYRRLFNESG